MREVSPVVDAKTGTVQVKVADRSERPRPAARRRGDRQRTRLRLDNVFVLPWTAMTAKDGKPAIWVVDPADNVVHLRPVDVARYEKERIILDDGLKPGESVVIEGGKFLARRTDRRAARGAEQS